MENISIIINVQQRGGQQLCKSSSSRRSQNDQVVIIALGDGDSFVFSRMLSTEAAVWENRDPDRLTQRQFDTLPGMLLDVMALCVYVLSTIPTFQS